jgi:hypothetical protein
MPSEQSITKYREIYRKQYGIEISIEEATEQSQRLLNLARVIFSPMPKNWLEQYKKLFIERIDNHPMDKKCL